ncbi:LamB/YcsF family protein [Glycomyces sp. L485]|uniref:LamB/YcsF family protein n=1 Tax=Glycomyces sp. L485 TaxID=2909235 RepID=UPI001F4A713A|nr:5-oxoprolinase subunit PxpA [Glycomyces sp. L485]MCH7229329.1 LamB/YcsF family protein [Glycomyces sp. L485]
MDLNADLGEGFGRWELTDDTGLLRLVTSANVACGFHAGDPLTIQRVCATAATAGVRIGAQVSYRDLAGFGRREMDVPPAELAAEIAYQIGALQVFARAADAEVRYVKPHGALYHRAGRDAAQAGAVIEGMRIAKVDVLLCGLGSELDRAAREAGLRVVGEAFADRAYQEDGRLVPRGAPGALLDRAASVAQAVDLAANGEVETVEGTRIRVETDSICIHGDGPEPVATSEAIRSALDNQGIKVEAFS